MKDFLEEAWIVERLAELDEPAKPQEALQRYRDAAEIYGRVGDVTQESSSLAFMARLYSRLKESALAAEAAGKSLERREKRVRRNSSAALWTNWGKPIAKWAVRKKRKMRFEKASSGPKGNALKLSAVRQTAQASSPTAAHRLTPP